MMSVHSRQTVFSTQLTHVQNPSVMELISYYLNCYIALPVCRIKDAVWTLRHNVLRGVAHE